MTRTLTELIIEDGKFKRRDSGGRVHASPLGSPVLMCYEAPDLYLSFAIANGLKENMMTEAMEDLFKKLKSIEKHYHHKDSSLPYLRRVIKTGGIISLPCDDDCNESLIEMSYFDRLTLENSPKESDAYVLSEKAYGLFGQGHSPCHTEGHLIGIQYYKIHREFRINKNEI